MAAPANSSILSVPGISVALVSDEVAAPLLKATPKGSRVYFECGISGNTRS